SVFADYWHESAQRQPRLGCSPILIGVVTPHNHENGADDDPEIEAQAPIVDIPKVTVDPIANFRLCRSRAAIAIDLRPTGQARFDVMSKRIITNDFQKMIVVCQSMRPRSNE